MSARACLWLCLFFCLIVSVFVWRIRARVLGLSSRIQMMAMIGGRKGVVGEVVVEVVGEVVGEVMEGVAGAEVVVGEE